MEALCHVCLSIAVILGLSACGDPRSAFVGTWNATTTLAMDLGTDGKSTSPGNLTFDIVRSATDPDEVTWASASCTFTGIVTTPTSLSVKPVVCPPAEGGSCLQLVISVKSGTGSLTGTALQLTYGGDISAVCGGKQVKGTVNNTLSASKL